MQQQVVYPATGQQQVLSQQVGNTTATGPTGPNVYETYASGQSQVLGILQIIIGALCIIFQSVAIGINSTTSVAGAGIWCGSFFILTGISGVTSAKYKTECQINCFMMLAVVGIVIFTILLIIVSSLGIKLDADYYRQCHTEPYFDRSKDRYIYPPPPSICNEYKEPSKIVMNAILLILVLMELGVGIGCVVVSCGASPSTQGVDLNQGQTVQYVSAGGQPQVVIMTNHPGMNFTQPAGVHYQTMVASGYPTTMPNPQVTKEAYQPQYAGQQQQQQQ